MRIQKRIIVIAAAFLLLAAYNGAAARQKPEVKIGRLICGGHLSLAVVEKEYREELSFPLKTVQNHEWEKVVEDLKTGRLDGTFILSPLAMELIRNGLPARIVLKADRNGNGFVLSEKIRSVGELAEKPSIIAVPHRYSQHNLLLHRLLKQRNIPKEKVTVIGMPPRNFINSMRRGEIDGFIVGEPEGNKSVSLGEGWMAARSPDIWKDHMDHVFIASDRFIKERPGELQELVNALVKAGMFIEANPKKAAVIGEDYTGSSADILEKVLTTPPDWIDYTDMVPAEREIREMAENLVEMGLWEKMPADLKTFVDDSFVRKAIGQSARR